MIASVSALPIPMRAVCRTGLRLRVDLDNGPAGMTGKSVGLSKGPPVGNIIDIQFLDYGNGLTLAGDAALEQRVEIIDRREICRCDNFAGARGGLRAGCRVVGREAVFGVRREVVQPDDADDGRRQRRGNPRIADIRDVPFPVDLEPMQLGVKCRPQLSRRAGKVDDRAVGVDAIDPEAVSLEPTGQRRDVGRGEAELGADLRRLDQW